MSCRLLQARTDNCAVDLTFGCDANETMWVRGGCRGIFQCGERVVWCPHGERTAAQTTTCACAVAAPEAAIGWNGCPTEGDLDDPDALTALVRARQTNDGDMTLLLYLSLIHI